MFVTRAWKTATISKNQDRISIIVPAPNNLGEKVIATGVVAGMAWGFCYLFIYDSMAHITSFSGFLGNAALALIFGFPFFFVVRGLLERAFAFPRGDNERDDFKLVASYETLASKPKTEAFRSV